ncbi:TPA: hypothetical protein ACKRQV_000006 [Pseudomonas aeruginosa]
MSLKSTAPSEGVEPISNEPVSHFNKDDCQCNVEALMSECKQLISEGKCIAAIKAYRAATGCGLAPAQRALGLR